MNQYQLNISIKKRILATKWPNKRTLWSIIESPNAFQSALVYSILPDSIDHCPLTLEFGGGKFQEFHGAVPVLHLHYPHLLMWSSPGVFRRFPLVLLKDSCALYMIMGFK